MNTHTHAFTPFIVASHDTNYNIFNFIRRKRQQKARKKTTTTTKWLAETRTATRIAVGPGNAHCMSVRHVSLRAGLAGSVLWPAAASAPAATAALSAAAAAIRQFTD